MQSHPVLEAIQFLREVEGHLADHRENKSARLQMFAQMSSSVPNSPGVVSAKDDLPLLVEANLTEVMSSDTQLQSTFPKVYRAIESIRIRDVLR